jgi:hypothetical protein
MSSSSSASNCRVPTENDVGEKAGTACGEHLCNIRMAHLLRPGCSSGPRLCIGLTRVGAAIEEEPDHCGAAHRKAQPSGVLLSRSSLALVCTPASSAAAAKAICSTVVRRGEFKGFTRAHNKADAPIHAGERIRRADFLPDGQAHTSLPGLKFVLTRCKYRAAYGVYSSFSKELRRTA